MTAFLLAQSDIRLSTSPRAVLAAVAVAVVALAAPGVQAGSSHELLGIVAPPPAAEAGPDIVRGLDGTATTPALAEAEAAATVREPPPPPPPPDHQRLRPPVARMDFPDPSVIAAGGRYYAFSTGSAGRNVQVASSADLFTWSGAGEALPTLPAWSTVGTSWAPAVAAIAGRYVLYVSLPQPATGEQCVDRFVADAPGGPYTQVAEEPLLCNPVGGTGVIDPFPYVTGERVYLYWKSAGSSSTQLYVTELSADGLSTLAPNGAPHGLFGASGGWEGGGVENPAMVRADGRYVLFYSANWWIDDRYSMGWAACDSPLGPCTKGRGPWLASRDGVSGPGGGSVFVDGSGQAFLAFHSWGGGLGYRHGGYRQLHVEPLDLGGTPSITSRAPVGSVDAVHRVPGGVRVAGGASDPDTPGPIDVEVRVNGWPVATRPAGRGFETVLALAAGHHSVCVSAIDDVGMSRPDIGCADVDVVDVPTGALEAASAAGPGVLRASGWALDPDTDAPVVVDLYVDRVLVQSVAADGGRPDIAAQYPWYGAAHGWTVDATVAAGDHEVCAYAADDGDHPSTNLGCAVVTVP